MLRHLGFIAGWAATTIAVVGLGWAAVSTVTATVTSAPPLARPPDVVVPAPATIEAPDPPAPASVEPGEPATTTPTPPAAADSPSPPVDEQAQTRTFDLVGGTVGTRADADAVELLFATPRPGFSVEVRSRGPLRVDIRFSSDDHESRFRLSPGDAERVEERPDSD